MKSHSLVCQLETGTCESVLDTGESIEVAELLTDPGQGGIELYYVTDPICSHCWALEPVLRRFFQQYRDYFTVHTVMGGLLEGWDGFTDKSNHISRPADVAHHWREVGKQSRMPIDGTLWHNDPVTSSFTASRVYKVIAATDPSRALTFLRRAREALFVFNQNIGSAEVLSKLVDQLGLSGKEIVRQSEESNAASLLQTDFDSVRALRIRAFPTIVMRSQAEGVVRVVGARPLGAYVRALEKLLPHTALKPMPLMTLASLLQQEELLFAREIEVYYALTEQELMPFILEHLRAEVYELHELLGEIYIKKKEEM